MPELVLYGIRLLAKQFLGAILDIEVDQSEQEEEEQEGFTLASSLAVSTSPRV